MQHVYTLPYYPNRDGSYGSNRGGTVADVQVPHSRGYSTAVHGILPLKTLEHGLSGDPQRQVREGHQRTTIPIGASAEVVESVETLSMDGYRIHRGSDSYSSRTTRRKTLTRSRNLATA